MTHFLTVGQCQCLVHQAVFRVDSPMTGTRCVAQAPPWATEPLVVPCRGRQGHAPLAAHIALNSDMMWASRPSGELQCCDKIMKCTGPDRVGFTYAKGCPCSLLVIWENKTSLESVQGPFFFFFYNRSWEKMIWTHLVHQRQDCWEWQPGHRLLYLHLFLVLENFLQGGRENVNFNRYMG